jgi:carboxymethylenebutenolidase
MVEAEVGVATRDGVMGTFVVHPDDTGPHPVVLFLMDAPGKRQLLQSMARRLAEHGYYVMLPNLYYRSTPAFELDFSSKESFARMSELMRGIGNRMVADDVAVLLAHADGDTAADGTRVGVVGYCMSGPFAIWTAAEHAPRVRAAASFYGVRLHVDSSDSPHRRLGEVTGELYVGCAEHDDYVPMEMVDLFEEAMRASGVAGRLERYWGTHHGFAFDDRPAYDAAADQRHWDALLDLFERNLHDAASDGPDRAAP